MEFFDVIKRRKSVRAFLDKEIPKDMEMKIKEAINLAPSAGDLQSYKVFVVKNESIKKRIADAAYGQMFVADAPLVLVFCADARRSSSKYGRRGMELYALQDATIAAAYAQLAATALGLSSVWVGAFDEDDVKEVIRTELRPVAIIPIGYAAKNPERTPRRSVEELFEEYL
ncbi:MAG: nitroreductase family protein [Candidatus Diapherotrites archaeon]|nr:nitroreductase family protein [Candidatus Diapherotrites archaeon]